MEKFLSRGKRIDNGKWYYGSYLFLHKSGVDWTGRERGKPKDVHYIINEQDINYAVDPATVGRDTGLPDKNGKKIFEGDIGRYRQTDGAKRNGAPILCTGKVVYNAETASYAVDSRDDAGCKYFDYFPVKDFEVIGNIHDNPELMEVTT